MAGIYSFKKAVDEALAVVGRTQDAPLRKQTKDFMNELVQRAVQKHSFRESYTRWEFEIPACRSVSRMRPLEIVDVPQDMDEIKQAWVLLERDGKLDWEPLGVVPMAEFERRFYGSDFRESPDIPTHIALRQILSAREDVASHFLTVPDDLTLGDLSGQGGWAKVEPPAYAAEVQVDTPVVGQRAIEFSPEGAPLPMVYSAVWSQDFEALANGELAGQDSFNKITGGVTNLIKVSSTVGEVIAGVQSAAAKVFPGGNTVLYTRQITPTWGTDWNLKWTMRGTDDGTTHRVEMRRGVSVGGIGVAVVNVNITDDGAGKKLQVVVSGTGTVYDAALVDPFGDHDFEVNVRPDGVGTRFVSVKLDAVEIVTSVAAVTVDAEQLTLMLFSTGAPPVGVVHSGSWDDFVYEEFNVAPYTPSQLRQYRKLTGENKRYQYTFRCRRNPDVAAGVDSLVSVMVRDNDDNVAPVDRVTGAVLGVDLAHQDTDSATLSVYHDGVLQLDALAIDVETDTEVCVEVDEERKVTVDVDGKERYSGTAAAVTMDRVLMSGDRGLLTYIAWQGKALDFVGLTVESDVLEAAALEVGVHLYTTRDRRSARPYKVTGISATPKSLYSGPFFGVKSVGKSDTSLGVVVLKTNSGTGEIARIMPQDTAASYFVIAAHPFADRTYRAAILYKMIPPIMVNDSDPFNFMPVVAVRWVIQEAKVRLMQGKEDADWAAEDQKRRELELEMIRASNAGQVDEARIEHDW